MFKQLFNNSSRLNSLYILHIFNDGYYASLFLFLPFIARDLNINLTQIGFLGTLTNAMGIIVALPAGFMAVKLGGYKVLFISLFLFGIGYLGIASSYSFWQLIPMFLLAGAGTGVFHPVAFAIVARISDKNIMGKLMGNFTAIGDIGRIGLSALLTFIIVYLGWHSTAYLLGIISIFSVLIFIYLWRTKRNHFTIPANKFTDIKLIEIMKNKLFIYSLFAAFCDSLASQPLFIFLPFLFLKRGIDPILLGSFTAVFFIGALFGKVILGRFVDKFGNSKVFIISEIIMAIFIFILATSTHITVIIIASVILGIFTKGTVPVVQTMVSEAAEQHGNFEKVFGINSFLISIAATITPVLLGFISDKMGIYYAFYVMALAAITAIIPGVLYHFSKQKGIR